MSQLKINPVIRELLVKRGYTGEEEMMEYLSPRPQLTYDPFLMKDMDEASDLIIEYAAKNKSICIYGDYDSDGINSVTLMLCLLRKLTGNVFFYIPSRFEEGYGLNTDAIDRIVEAGGELIITVDCGSVSFNEVEYAKSKGLQVIVTDHHNIDERAADCLMLNPKQKDDQYPFSYLCGCGVAFKLAQAISRKTDFSKSDLNSLLDLTGIATIGDIVPLVDENRTLVKYGIDRIKRQQRKSLSGLIKKIGMDPSSINSGNIAFGIVPHLNSCGRMETADIGVDLLMSEDEACIDEITDHLVELNSRRRSVQNQVYDEASAYINDNCADDGFIFYDAGNSHEGITGIVAGKLKDDFHRPVIIITDTDNPEIAKGTGRSIEGVNLYNLLKKHDSLFIKFGGHAGACGFSMKKSDAGLLRNQLNKDMERIISENPGILEAKLNADIEIDADDVNLDMALQIEMMEPFGEGNRRPLFLIKNAGIAKVFAMGKEKQYRRISCVSSCGNTFDMVVFDGKIVSELDSRKSDSLDAIAEININCWNGRKKVQAVARAFV